MTKRATVDSAGMENQNRVEAYLSALIESAEDLIWSVDLDYRLVLFNRAFEQLARKVHGDAIAVGYRPTDRLPAEKAAEWQRFYDRALADGSFRIEHSAGDGRIFEFWLNPVVLDGEPAGVSVLGREITERKRAEEARRFLAEIVEGSEDGILAYDPAGRILTWNRGAESIFGYAAEEAIGKTMALVVPPERRAAVAEHTEQMLKGRASAQWHGIGVRKDGARIDLSVTSWPMRNPDGTIRAISLIVRDVTAHREGQRAQALLASIVESSMDAIHAVDRDGKIVSWNRGSELLHGYEKGEIVGQNFAVLIPPERRDEAQKAFAAVLRGGAIGPFDASLRGRDGRDIDVSLSLSPIRSADGTVVGVSAVAHDIRKRKQAERELRESRDVLEEAQVIGGLGSYVLDVASGRWTSSQLLGELLGIDAEFRRDMAGWVGLLHPEDREMMVRYLEDEVLGRKQIFDKEFRIVRHNDGAVRWVHGRGRLEFDAQGHPVRMLGVIRDVTAHTVAMRELAESEARFRRFFEQNGSIMLLIEPHSGEICGANEAAAEFYGYTRQQLVAMNIDRINTLPAEEVARQRERALKEERTRFNFRHRLADGEERDVEVYSSPMEVDGRLLLFSTVHDVSDQRRAEAQLRASETRYRSVFHTSLDGVCVSQLSDGRYIDVNKAFLDMFGYEREEVIGRTSFDLHLWVNPEERQEIAVALNAGLRLPDVKTRFLRKSGEPLWIQLSLSPIEIEGVACILSVVRDISAAKAGEEQLASAQRALAASEARYRTVFQTSLDSISISRVSDGRYIDCNQAFLDVMGFTREEVIGRTSLELNIWTHPLDREKLMEILRQTHHCRDLEAQFRRKDGEVIWGQMSASVIEIEGEPCVLSLSRDISAAKLAEKEIRTLAFYDTLTGLPNRRLVSERLRQCLVESARTKRRGALLFIDLDNFKTLNDTLGHTAGDLLLKEVARRLTRSVREADTVARLGGDEFVVIAENLSENKEEAATQAKLVAEKILEAARRTYVLADRECASSCSVGIALFGEGAEKIDDILQHADIAMYQAKAGGRNTMRFFAPALQAAIHTRASMEDDLRLALGSKQFELHYQPQVEEGKIVGAEALLRWRHPERGLLGPDEFVPLAEETGLILPLGEWVLETACQQIAAWSQRGATAQMTVAVNISARQLRQPDFVEQVLRVLERTGADGRNLDLELTESMLVENLDDVIVKMTRLKEWGLRFSLDDFGTGYSSLSYLKRLPLNQLKIDRVFVRDMLVDLTSGTIAQIIISLGEAMGLSVIAEGVETEMQREFLAGLGCHAFQGYLVSPPLPVEDFEVLLPPPE